MASAAIGAIVTMVTRSVPGTLLGLFVVAGTVAAALAVRPRAGRMILPVPALSYLVAALISGFVSDRAAASSRTELAIAAAQWIADGFFAMALATILAAAIITVRWFVWRRSRPAKRDPAWPVPAAGPTRADAVRAGTARAGTARARTGRRSRADWESSAESGPAAGSRGTGPRPGPRSGSGPYNFSSGA